MSGRKKHAARERRPSDRLLADLSAISARAAELGVDSDATDFDVAAELEDVHATVEVVTELAGRLGRLDAPAPPTAA